MIEGLRVHVLTMIVLKETVPQAKQQTSSTKCLGSNLRQRDVLTASLDAPKLKRLIGRISAIFDTFH